MTLRALFATSLFVVLSTTLDAGENRGTAASRISVQTNRKIVVWSINVRAASKQLSKTIGFCDREAKKVLDVLRELGIKPEEVHTDFPIMKKRHNRSRPQRPTGYSVRKTVTFIQRDSARFDEFFNKIAALESEYHVIKFQFASPNWKHSTTNRPQQVLWQATLVGSSKTLLRAREFHDRSMKATLTLLEKFDINSEDIKSGYPSMEARYRPDEPEKPTGHSYQTTLIFTQRDASRFRELVAELSKMESDYFYFDFTFQSKSTR